MRISVIGCGNIGEKRIRALGPDDRVVVCADTRIEKAHSLAALATKNLDNSFKTIATTRWEEAVSREDIDAVLVATTHDVLPLIGKAALECGKHILIEKPAAKSSQDIECMIKISESKKKNIHVGFNHRFHPAFRKARQLVSSGEIGPLMFIRARYGHGGRLGYEKEWRALPEISGGGELLDQGMHVIDLSQWFLGRFKVIKGSAMTYFWNMPVDDNAFMLLQTEDKTTAFIHVSCTEWKNTFSFEIYGKYGKLDINGLGRSYGIERLALYKMSEKMGPPETTIWEYPGEDDSWIEEWSHFKKQIQSSTFDNSSCIDARDGLRVVEEVYRQSGYSF